MAKNDYELIKKASSVVPSERQLKWQELEFSAIVYFGLNTFVNAEHGNGRTEANAFFPTDFDANQWVEIFKNAGMRELILTCKLEEGFCLWPSKLTDYSVKFSPYMEGNGDIVREVSEACKNGGLKFGIYLSPCDIHEESFGSGKKYDDFFVGLLGELLTEYGEISEVRFDSKNLDMSSGKHQEYDWKRYYDCIRTLQPNACITLCGPDARHIGNTLAITRPSEWSVVPATLDCQDKVVINPDAKTGKKDEKKMQLDLASRKVIAKSDALCWYPAFADISMRKHWFYHKDEDLTTMLLEQLKAIYYRTVGANCNLTLGVPADQRGKLPEAERITLAAFGCDIQIMKKKPLIEKSVIEASCESDENHCAKNMKDDSKSYWCSGETDGPIEIEIEFSEISLIKLIEMRENIATGQQIEKFSIYYLDGKKWKKSESFTVIGNLKYIRPKKPFLTQKIKIVIEQYRCFATLKKIEMYAY